MPSDQSNEIDDVLDTLVVDELVETDDNSNNDSENPIENTPTDAEKSKDSLSYVGIDEINRIGDKLDISQKTRDKAQLIFEKYNVNEATTETNPKTIAAACLYVACEIESKSIGLDEFVEVNETNFRSTFFFEPIETLDTLVGININAFVDPSDYINDYCKELNLKNEVAEKATNIFTQAIEKVEIGGKNPDGVAGAAIYNATRLFDAEVTQSDIADIINISEYTISKEYRNQQEYIDMCNNIKTKSKNNIETNKNSTEYKCDKCGAIYKHHQEFSAHVGRCKGGEHNSKNSTSENDYCSNEGNEGPLTGNDSERKTRGDLKLDTGSKLNRWVKIEDDE